MLIVGGVQRDATVVLIQDEHLLVDHELSLLALDNLPLLASLGRNLHCLGGLDKLVMDTTPCQMNVICCITTFLFWASPGVMFCSLIRGRGGFPFYWFGRINKALKPCLKRENITKRKVDLSQKQTNI